MAKRILILIKSILAGIYLTTLLVQDVQVIFFIRANGGKWVRYDQKTGKMVKGLQKQNGLWYYFDPVTGAMAHGNTWVPQWQAWHYFDSVTGRG
nr:hypothetical protein [Bifidobacterium catenulatum]